MGATNIKYVQLSRFQSFSPTREVGGCLGEGGNLASTELEAVYEVVIFDLASSVDMRVLFSNYLNMMHFLVKKKSKPCT